MSFLYGQVEEFDVPRGACKQSTCDVLNTAQTNVIGDELAGMSDATTTNGSGQKYPFLCSRVVLLPEVKTLLFFLLLKMALQQFPRPFLYCLDLGILHAAEKTMTGKVKVRIIQYRYKYRCTKTKIKHPRKTESRQEKKTEEMEERGSGRNELRYEMRQREKGKRERWA